MGVALSSTPQNQNKTRQGNIGKTEGPRKQIGSVQICFRLSCNKKWVGVTGLGQEYGAHCSNQGNAMPRSLKTNAIQDFDIQSRWFDYLFSVAVVDFRHTSVKKAYFIYRLTNTLDNNGKWKTVWDGATNISSIHTTISMSPKTNERNEPITTNKHNVLQENSAYTYKTHKIDTKDPSAVVPNCAISQFQDRSGNIFLLYVQHVAYYTILLCASTTVPWRSGSIFLFLFPSPLQKIVQVCCWCCCLIITYYSSMDRHQ